jgi:hypothetical protein
MPNKTRLRKLKENQSMQIPLRGKPNRKEKRKGKKGRKKKEVEDRKKKELNSKVKGGS